MSTYYRPTEPIPLGFDESLDEVVSSNIEIEEKKWTEY